MLKEGCPVSTCLKMCPKIRLTVARLYPKIWPKDRFIFENLIETSFIILIIWNLYGEKLSLFCYEKKIGLWLEWEIHKLTDYYFKNGPCQIFRILAFNFRSINGF